MTKEIDRAGWFVIVSYYAAMLTAVLTLIGLAVRWAYRKGKENRDRSTNQRRGD